MYRVLRELLAGCVWFSLVSGYPANAEGDFAKRLEKLEIELGALRNKVKSQKQKIERQQRQLEAAGITEARPSFPRPGREGEEGAARKTPSLGNVYSKPFLLEAGQKVHLGGYADLEFINKENSDSRFDQHRLIPFIYADISDQLKFATEIEFEHGAAGIDIEFAHLDFLLADWLNFRGGIILTPLGKLNLVHDSPLQDLTERPLIDRNIFPSTLSESGVGFYGEVYPSDSSKLSYEFYAVNGFDGGDSTNAADVLAKFNNQDGIRKARGSKQADNNNNKAFTGRLAFSPFLGAEIGGSFHYSKWDDQSRNSLAIYGVDWTFQKGPFEFLGEAGWVDIEIPDSIKNATRASSGKLQFLTGDMFGYYTQGNYHFMFDWLKESAPVLFKDESTFTAVVRWGDIDLGGPNGDRTRLTLGLNFRPIERTVFKLDYQFNDGDRIGDRDDVFLFSFATYF